MRVHRLRIKDFRGIADREVAFADSGVTVVEGANEAGKSSMIEALDLLLTEKADSRKARVRAVQPAGRDVGSEVFAEISCGPWRFEYFKRFNKKSEASLTIIAPVREQHTGRAAHERVDELLGQSLDRALFSALQLLQSGAPELGGLADSAALAKALDRAAGAAEGGGADTGADDDEAADEDSGEDAALIAAVTAEYQRYFTAGQGRPTGEYAEARKAEKAARDAVKERRELLAALEEVTERLPEVDARLAVHHRDEEAAAVRVADLDAQVTKGETLEQEVLSAESRLGQLTAELAMAQGRCADRDRTQAQLAELAADVQRQQEQESGLRAQAAQAQAAAQALEEELTGAKAKLRRLQEQVDAARAAAAVRADRARLARLDETLQRLAELDDRIETRQTALAANPVLARHVEAADDLDRQLTRATARMEAAVATVELTVLGDQPVLLDGAPLSSPHTLTAVGEQTLEVPGVLRAVVRGGADAQSLAAAVASLQQQAAQLCADCGVAELGRIRTRATARETLNRELASDRAERTAVLGGAEPAALRAEQSALAERLAGTGAETEPADLDALTVAERELTDLTRSAEATAAAQRAKAVEAAARADALAAATERARTGLAAQTETLAAARAQLSDEALRGAAVLAAGHRDDAVRALAAVQRELAALNLTDLRAALAEAEQQAQRIRDQLAALREERTALTTRLEVCRDDGRLDALGDAEAEYAAAEAQLNRIAERAAGAQALYETLHRKRAESRSRYVAPFTRRLEELAAPVFGDSVRFEVGDDFAIARRTLDGVTVDVAALSGGAREQLGLIARLACAMLVDEQDGVPVILDDALGYSDPARLASMAQVLGAAAGDAQIIVLTCDPQRYADVPDATMIAV